MPHFVSIVVPSAGFTQRSTIDVDLEEIHVFSVSNMGFDYLEIPFTFLILIVPAFALDHDFIYIR